MARQKVRDKKGRFLSKNVKTRLENLKKKKITWRDGRRVVDLRCLADNLGECSNDRCGALQDLRNIVEES